MEEDKIQSTAAGLSIQLQNVPKLLGNIKKAEDAWAPEAFLVGGCCCANVFLSLLFRLHMILFCPFCVWQC
jgi:hypothetical protein